jgi:hypothetical protein
MAFRTSARLLGVALGVAALAGASQLGLAYGLGILGLNRSLDVTMRDHWTAELAWVAWFAMTSAVVGGMAGRSHLPTGSGAGTRLVTAVAAGVGAAIVVPLTMQPARSAHVSGVQPVFVIGVCAALGAAAGIFAAYAALSRLVARWSFTAMGAAIWAIALLSVAPSMAPGKTLPDVRLGVLDAEFLSSSTTQRTALFTMPLLALIGGVVLGLAARRRGLSTLTIALAGLAGPALLTVAYLVAGPGSAPDQYQAVPYWAAMTAAGAGVLGSVLAAVLRREAPGPTGSPLSATATPDRPPLPRRESSAESAIAQAAATAAQRPADQLRPSDTGVFSMNDLPTFDGFKATASAPAPHPAHSSTPAHGSAPAPAPAHGSTPAHGGWAQTPAPAPTAQATAPVQRSRGRRSKPQSSDGVADWVSGLGN